jgi:hypothetical protein
MRKTALLFAVYLFVAASSVAAQETAVSLSSAVPDSARFQVVQSPLLAKLAFRLDRFTGDTWQFVSKQKGGFSWQRVERIELPNDIKSSGKVNYQIFLSGIRAQITVLINTNTGASWYIAEDPKEGIFWSPID